MIIKASNLITPAFHSLWRSKATFQVAKGGRSSGKSTTIAFKIVTKILKAKVNALVVRKVGNTLRKSCFEQIKESIYLMDIEHLFRYKESNLEIIYKPTGQIIMFRGADDPGKIKGIKVAKYPIAILWIEELADFKDPDEVDIILDSIIRADIGMDYTIFMSYNPPKRKSSWVNKKYESKVNIPKDTFIHQSTSFDNPYLSAQFLSRAREKEETNNPFFRWNYLGEPLGGGLVPFNNLEFKSFKTKHFDNVLQGLDWGYGVDPLAMTRMHYDRSNRILYVFGEIYRQKMHEMELSSKIKLSGWNDTRIIADSASPDRISTLNSYGIRTIGARKGPGSVESGLEWLDSLEQIIIDPHKAPHTAEEFELSEYDIDKYGELIPRLNPKLPDHSIDAIRYATEDEQRLTRDLEERYK